MSSVPVRELELSAFEPYGTFTRMIDNPRITAALPRPVVFRSEMIRVPLAEATTASFSICRVAPREFVITGGEYHNKASEGILPLDEVILIHVAPPTNPRMGIPADQFELFRVPVGTMVVLRPGAGHGAPCAAGDKPANGVVNTFVALYAQERGIPDIGLFFTVSDASMLAMRILGGRLLDRYGLNKILYPAYALAGIAMFLMAGAYALPLVLFASMVRSFGQSAAQPALQATCIRKLGRDRSGVATSTYFVGADVGQGLGPIIGGALSEVWGYGTLYAGTGAILLIAMGIYALY